MAESFAGSDLLTAVEVPLYLQQRWPKIWSQIPGTKPTAREVGDGNLNLVFVVRADGEPSGIALKQSMPYVRLVGESWPLTSERAAAEARAYAIYSRIAPDLVPSFHGYDADRHVLVVEDLSDLHVWRTALNDAEIHPRAAAAMGTLVALVGFWTSDFGMDGAAKKALAAESIDPELCRITEDLVFSEPYMAHEHNRYGQGLEASVLLLREDQSLRTEISDLKHRFMTQAEALIHGDLHTGSVMVGGGRTVAFDLEFAFYGPVAFDLGALWGNFIIAAARADRTNADSGFRAHVASLLAESWTSFDSTFRSCWSERVDTSFGGAFLDRYLERLWTDSLGFAAAKAIRRIVGIAQVSDIQGLPEPERTSAAEAVLRAARRLAIERPRLPDPPAAWRVVQEEIGR